MLNNTAFRRALQKIQSAKKNQLKRLDLSYLGLIRVPSTIRELTWLSDLELYGGIIDTDGISDISFLEALPNLKKLVLHTKYLDDLSALGNLINLTELNLYEVTVTDLAFLKSMPLLEKLSIWFEPKAMMGKSIEDSSCFSGLTQLKSLSIGFSFIEHEYSLNLIHDFAFIEHMPLLEELYLNDLEIKNIDFLKHHLCLNRLVLANNLIEDITMVVGLTNLEFLILPNNKITDIIYIRGLTKLTNLNLDNNPIIFKVGEASKSLSTLPMPVKSINLTLTESDTEQLIVSTKDEISNTKENLPTDTNKIVSVKGTELIPYQSVNEKSVDKEFGKYLTTNPNYDALKSLPNLRVLHCRNNEMDDITFIKDLKKIETLFFDNNPLFDVSVFQQYKFDYLRVVSFENCFIENIEPFKHIPQLVDLNLNKNFIENIPSLEGFHQLQKLNIANNLIKSIHKDWLKATELVDLVIDSDSIDNIHPLYLRDLGNWKLIDNLKNYFDGAFPNEKFNNIIKLLIVGNQNTGKTILQKALSDWNEWRLSEKLCFKIIEVDSLPFHHQIQEFWMRSEALILVVWDLEQENQKTPYHTNYPIEYWLEMTKKQFVSWQTDMTSSFSKYNFVFLLQSKINLPDHYDTAPQNYGKLLKKYEKENIVKHSVDIVDNYQLAQLKDKLIELGEKILENRSKITAEWWDVQQKVKKNENVYIRLEHLKQIITDCKLNEAVTPSMIYWLHNIGTISYIDDTLIILNEKYILNQIRYLFSNGSTDWFSKMIKANNGIFHSSLLTHFEIETLLSKEVLLKLMEAYQIAYPLPDNHWCIPSWSHELQQTQVYDVFSNKNHTRFFKKYEYDFYSYAEITNCIVNIYKYASIYQQWTNGIYFKYSKLDHTYGLFEADMQKYHVTIGITSDITINALELLNYIYISMANSIVRPNDANIPEYVSIDKAHFVPIDTLVKYANELGKISFDYNFHEYKVKDFIPWIKELLLSKELTQKDNINTAAEIQKMIFFSIDTSKTKNAKRNPVDEIASIKKEFELYQDKWCCVEHRQVSPTAFFKIINDSNIGIVHFSGDSINNCLIFMSEDGRSKEQMTILDLARKIKTVRKYNLLKLIVLHTSDSHIIAKEISEISKLNTYVLGIEGDIRSVDIATSSETFYHSLLKHNFDVERAVEFAGDMIKNTNAEIVLYYKGDKINKNQNANN